MNIIEQQQQHFNGIASEYHDSFNSDTAVYLICKMWNILLKNSPLPTDQRIQRINFLDAMCGNAVVLDVFRKLGFTGINYNAFDYSPRMVAFAKARYPDCRIFEQDITTFCEPNTYDAICVMAGLHHVPTQAEKVMANIYKSLKPGGLFFSAEPIHHNTIFGKIRNFIYAHNRMFDYESEKGFSADEWNALVANNNLIVEHQIYPGLLAYVLIQIPFLFSRKFRYLTKLKIANISINYCIRKWIDIESHLWGTSIARYFSFATFGCYRKPGSTTSF